MTNSIEEEGVGRTDVGSNIELENNVDIDTIDGLKSYFDSKLSSLRMEVIDLRAQQQKQSIYTHPHVVKQDEEISFLRDELTRRREDFQQREKSMQKVIEILGDENSRASTSHHLAHAVNAVTGESQKNGNIRDEQLLFLPSRRRIQLNQIIGSMYFSIRMNKPNNQPLTIL